MSRLISFLAVLLLSALVLSSCILHRHTPYHIHFVNYRGMNDVNLGFEHYLKQHHVSYDITYHDMDRDPALVPGIIADIRADRDTDLIVTWGTTATLSIVGTYDDKSAGVIKDIPTIFTLVTDPIAAKIVRSNDRPDGNVTGSWHIAPIRNQFRSMMIYKPFTRKIGMIYTPTEKNSIIARDELTRLAALHNVEVVAIPFDVIDGKPVATNATAAIDALQKAGVDWVYLPPDSFLGVVARDVIIPHANQHGIPTFASTEQLMNAGATFGLLSSYFQLGELTAEKAEKILVQGMKPADIPVDTVARFRHKMNTAAARNLGISISAEMLKSIDEVVN